MYPAQDEFLIDKAANKIAEKLELEELPEDKITIIRMWRALYVQLGGNLENMLHWMNTYNKHLGYIPAKNVTDEIRLADMINYLEYEK